MECISIRMCAAMNFSRRLQSPAHPQRGPSALWGGSPSPAIHSSASSGSSIGLLLEKLGLEYLWPRLDEQACPPLVSAVAKRLHA